MHIFSVTICHSGISNRGLQKHWNERWVIIQRWLQQTKFSILQWRFWRVSISFSNNTFIVLSFHKPTWQKIRDPKCRENTLIKYNEDNYLSPGSQRLQYGWKKTHAHVLVNRTGESASYKDRSLHPQAVQCKNNQGGKWERTLIGIENSKWNKKCS